MIKYLREEKGYTCIQEITLYNEPNSFYNRYGAITGHELYTEMCIATDEAFKEAGIRQDVKFNLSDDARDSTWLGKSAGHFGRRGGYPQFAYLRFYRRTHERADPIRTANL